ncbi:MAG: hypothetical protein ACREJX_10825, partial [Polyangiaceae bacterium]
GVVGARGLGIHAHFVRGSMHDDDQVASSAGIVELTSCDSVAPDRLVLTAVSGRGALEIVVAYSRRPLVSLRTIYPERIGALIPAVPEPGPLGPLPPVAHRADLAEARAKNEGASIAARQSYASDGEGSGSLQLPLEAGCHRIEIFGDDPRAMGARVARLDVDAEVRDADDDTVLARDRSEAPDAHLDACIGGETMSEVFFAGAVPKSDVVITHAVWPIPNHLPLAWGHEPRARMAAALLLRHAPNLEDEPVFLAQGPAGVTPVPFDVEAGACYIAVAAIAHGTPRGLCLRVVAGSETSADERGLNDDSGAIAFCARQSDRAKIVVDARGVSLAWALAVYKSSSGARSDR